MADPRFSIVIPTRERADTLRYALRTCIAQQFDSYEIIVCDNCSSPATKQTVESFRSAKIKYVRSDRPLAMSDNWELAVSHASGEYVMVIGDDDGLLFHALRDIDYLLQQLNTKVLRWERVYYSWPNVPIAWEANKLHIPMLQGDSILRAREVIPKIANNRMAYTLLPMLYNSAIHQEMIGRLRKATGRVFRASAPDVYSGFAFAYLAQTYPSTGRPMSINAASARSSGVATLGLNCASPIAEEFYRLNNASGLGCHPRVPDIPVLPAAIANCFCRAKDALFPHDPNLHIDRRQLVLDCIEDIRAQSEEEWQKNIQAIRDSIADDRKLSEWFEKRFAHDVPRIRRTNPPQEPGKGFDGWNLHLDAAEFGVRDVYGAAGLCDRIMDYSTKPIEWRHRAKHPTVAGFVRRIRLAARVLLKGY